MCKNKWSAALICLLAVGAQANECDTLRGQMKEAQAQKNFVTAMDYINKIDDEYCFNPTERKRLQMSVLRDWGDELLQKVFQGQVMRFDKAQSRQLQQLRNEINTASDASAGNTIRDNWRIVFLKQMLLLTDSKKKDFDLETMNILDQILLGFIDDVQENRLSPVVAEVEMDEFIKQLIEAGLLYANPQQMAVLSKKRGNGQSAIRQLVQLRGANLSSSVSQPAVAITPMRFAYDSTQLNDQGEIEYKENFPNMAANLTNSIFLIGHTDAKGDEHYNCWLSQCRVLALKQRLIADGIPEHMIEVAWAGENIPLMFDRAGQFLQERDIVISAPTADGSDPAQRRVEYELNGKTLKDKYRGKFCQLTANYAARPCNK